MANKKITDLTDIGTPANDDLLEIVDVSDLTDSPEGTSKKVLVSALGGGSTPTLQDVTDEGAITTNTIAVTDGAGTETAIEPIGVTITDPDNSVNINSGGLLIQNAYNETQYAPEGIAIADLNTNEAIWLKTNGLEKYIGSGLITSVEFETPTGERTITFKDESGTVALTSDIPPAITIDATPTDGSSNAVSSNGVFDALALKTNTTVATTGVDIFFVTPQIYNTSSSPATANITNNLTGANLGIIQKIYHNHSVAPTVPGGWVLIGGEYKISELNIIYAEWCGSSRVEYWITQEV